MAQPLPIQSWKSMVPCVVWAVKFGASALILSDMTDSLSIGCSIVAKLRRSVWRQASGWRERAERCRRQPTPAVDPCLGSPRDRWGGHPRLAPAAAQPGHFIEPFAPFWTKDRAEETADQHRHARARAARRDGDGEVAAAQHR